jgi:pyruvate dehydrogenase E1 component
VWSVTSWSELRRDALEADDHDFRHPDDDPRIPYVTRALAGAPGPVIAVSDYMRAVPDQIRQWVPQEFVSLGTDGFGISDTRPAARRYFGVDGPSIAARVLQQLSHRGEVAEDAGVQAVEKYKILDVRAGTTGTAGGDS